MKFCFSFNRLLSVLTILALLAFLLGVDSKESFAQKTQPPTGITKAPSPTPAETPTPPAPADDNDVYFDEEGNSFPSKGFEFLSSQSIRQNAVYSKCPRLGFSIVVSFPTSTGNEAVDKLILDDFSQRFATKKADNVKALKELECPAPKPATPAAGEEELEEEDEELEADSIINFQAFAPGPGFLSVIYQDFDSPIFAAHPSTSFFSQTYLIGQGRVMNIKDLFPDPAKSAPLLWAYLAPKWCEQSHALGNEADSIPNFYTNGENDLTSCQAAKLSQVPARLKKADLALADLGNPVFTPEGAFLNLGAYDGWSYADGPASLEIPKAELLKMGANPAIWGGR
ncbi:MAG: hypothetical protein LBI10_02835 [Deltaproteobacteria bacterium]|jgi:hypothetical protein|nr:hypothetical protein [Deltaproteobacteria bacterium]